MATVTMPKVETVYRAGRARKGLAPGNKKPNYVGHVCVGLRVLRCLLFARPKVGRIFAERWVYCVKTFSHINAYQPYGGGNLAKTDMPVRVTLADIYVLASANRCLTISLPVYRIRRQRTISIGRPPYWCFLILFHYRIIIA